MPKVLTPAAALDREEFEAEHGPRGNCACHLYAPCNSCQHPGNPLYQEEQDACWMWEGLADMLDEMERNARAAVAATIERATAQHLSEMATHAIAKAARNAS